MNKSLLELCDVKTGKVDANHASVDGKYTFFTCALEPMRADSYSFEGELIVLPGNGANVGHVDFYKGKIEAYQRTYVLHNIHIDSLFLYYHLKAYWKKRNEEKQFGSATNYIKMGNFKDYIVSFPPLTEQKRIVEKLDEVLAQVDTIKARLDGIPSLLKRFRQSVLASAVSGKLTEEWRGGSPANWDAAKLKDFVQSIEAGKNLKCIETPPVDDEHGIIKISAVTWGVYDEGQSKTLPDNRLFIENRRINVGDFLISRANTIELLGNPVIVHQVTKNLMLSDKVLRLVMEECDKPWVSIFLRSKEGRKQIESRSTGNQMSMRNIGQKALLDIDLPRFSLEEQKEIVRLVDQYFAFADTIEAQVKKAQARVNNLTQSILAKAFRGELVPQDPNDESADKLLERIAQARIEAEALAKAAKKAETARKKAEKATAKG
ncbi:hypothetical protein ERW54_03610 [Aliivibrio finisterrensis]|uniref:restriction endonuclease subunit S n=1 Tax=Aliivibrio finisterrensis TaxID=511998 RepID=UPI0010228551|nr:restriction endonuclease subunit S [Aliivibrio finisterrensis]RYU70606.1 hypothetical protein ERW54_03610 [Aliivibrio finisterrensis]